MDAVTRGHASQSPPRVEVVIEIPRGSFLKRGSTGHVDFVSPLPCPFNYGSVPAWLGGEGDLLDAVVLGPRLAIGTRLTVPVRGAVGLAERRLYDDKLICSEQPLGWRTRAAVVGFFRVYICAKRGLNLLRGLPTDGRCTGWGAAQAALQRASPRPSDWRGPPVPF
ncbi:inorganic diphosphatase [Spiribacter halobius]|uniref:inorganic diphosphatase n=1 Tax=Sediminicurvatus halobius TaxID=2182432 RepID=A0A2U2N577_9GAMM|nr:inorganic diphosphatase [Spiribacter halobius]PWG64381.1 inorganic pyrophosphatase [Spiribacter halobius]UEX79271.1 inorganic diphosphatase [Spiribacter halobius]